MEAGTCMCVMEAGLCLMHVRDAGWHAHASKAMAANVAPRVWKKIIQRPSFHETLERSMYAMVMAGL